MIKQFSERVVARILAPYCPARAPVHGCIILSRATATTDRVDRFPLQALPQCLTPRPPLCPHPPRCIISLPHYPSQIPSPDGEANSSPQKIPRSTHQRRFRRAVASTQKSSAVGQVAASKAHPHLIPNPSSFLRIGWKIWHILALWAR